MSIRLTGIASGLDTDSMVQELVSAYSLKKENYEKYFNLIEALKESHRLLEEDSEIDPMKWRKRKEELINKIGTY